MKPIINKIVIQLEEIHQEIGHKIEPPSRKVTVAAVIKNPYAKQYIEDLEELYDLCEFGVPDRVVRDDDSLEFFRDRVFGGRGGCHGYVRLGSLSMQNSISNSQREDGHW